MTCHVSTEYAMALFSALLLGYWQIIEIAAGPDAPHRSDGVPRSGGGVRAPSTSQESDLP